MKRFLKAPAFSCVVVALFAALLLKGGGAEAAPMQSYGSNNIDAGAQPFKALNAVVEVSARDIWAVGDSFSLSTGVEQTLIEHWDGTSWSIVPSPNPTTTHDTFLSGVAEVSANDVWAVGGSGQTLIEHWNGEHWRIVASPNPPGSTGSLGAVAEVSAHDIWAVGTFKNSTGGLPLIEHWDGEQWSIVASPNPTGSSFTVLNGVAEVSAHNVWAVGRTNQSLTEHWNGKQWSIVPSPNPTGSSFTVLNGVTEVSAHNVWAVGGYFTSVGSMVFQKTLIEHWNGKQWSIVPSPNVSGSTSDILNGVEEVSARNIWAVGVFFTRSAGGLPLIEHWNGVQWSIVPGAD